MNGKELAEKTALLALEKKAESVISLNLKGLSPVADYFVIASGGSEAQVKAISDHIQDELVKLKIEPKVKPWHVEGEDTQRWILLDFVNVVVHVFRRETREYYALEKLWGDAPTTHYEDLPSSAGGQAP